MESSVWLSLLVDPIDRQPPHLDDRELIAASGVRYPIVDGIPVLIRPDLPPTHRSSIRTVKRRIRMPFERAAEGELN